MRIKAKNEMKASYISLFNSITIAVTGILVETYFLSFLRIFLAQILIYTGL